MSSLVIHPQTDHQLTAFKAKPSHAVLLHGPAGSGKGSVARSLAADVLTVTTHKLDAYPYLLQLDAPSISSSAIESIRQLEHFLSLKVPSTSSISRIVIITDAQTLSMQAQNALLKTLEEPPEATLLILTATNQASLLATISSRIQAIAIKPPAQALLQACYRSDGHSVKDIDQAYAMSGGLPGLMTALLTNADHPLQSATHTARQLLQQTIYERLLQVEELVKQKTLAINTLFILQQMAHARLQSTTGAQFNRWQQILQASYEASEKLNHNGQPKLVLDALMLKLN